MVLWRTGTSHLLTIDGNPTVCACVCVLSFGDIAMARNNSVFDVCFFLIGVVYDGITSSYFTYIARMWRSFLLRPEILS